MSKIEDAVAKKLLLRAKIGEKKYGTTMERNDLSLEEWLNHLQEELLDATVYLEKLKQEIQYQEMDLAQYKYDGEECDGELGSHPLCSTDYCPCKEEEIEKRMNIIGRNGNDGLHYDNRKGPGLHHGPCSMHAFEGTMTMASGDIEVTYEIQETKRKENN